MSRELIDHVFSLKLQKTERLSTNPTDDLHDTSWTLGRPLAVNHVVQTRGYNVGQSKEAYIEIASRDGE